MALLALALDAYARDWLDLLIRLLHVIAAIGWIGSSFYFVLLDQSLRKPADPADTEAGVGGELWEVHGGGFYHVKKYKVAPPELPDHLEWFKWEAYTTWLSGFALLVVLYWFDARTYMIDASVADISPLGAVGISAGLLLAAWLVYNLLCRIFRSNERALALSIAAGITLAAWGTGELFSPRAAWLQTGAMIGTIMAANVFFNIIPAHWELIRAKEAGREPDPAPGIEAKRRSVHNNYFTLPVLITMLAGHFSFLTGQQNAWVVLVVMMAVLAWIRHFYNLRHGGTTHWWMPAVAAVVVLILVAALAPDDAKKTDSVPGASRAAGKKLFVENQCGSCHTLSAVQATGKTGPNLDAAKPTEEEVIKRVSSGGGGMPAFAGRLSKRDIASIGVFVANPGAEAEKPRGK